MCQPVWANPTCVLEVPRNVDDQLYSMLEMSEVISGKGWKIGREGSHLAADLHKLLPIIISGIHGYTHPLGVDKPGCYRTKTEIRSMQMRGLYCLYLEDEQCKESQYEADFVAYNSIVKQLEKTLRSCESQFPPLFNKCSFRTSAGVGTVGDAQNILQKKVLKDVELLLEQKGYVKVEDQLDPSAFHLQVNTRPFDMVFNPRLSAHVSFGNEESKKVIFSIETKSHSINYSDGNISGRGAHKVVNEFYKKLNQVEIPTCP